MISLATLAALTERYAEDLARAVAPVRIGDRSHDTDRDPVLMGTINLSRDSTYRESIATSRDSAMRKARVQTAQGAHCVDLGAESSNAGTARMAAEQQIEVLVPIVTDLAAEGIVVSVETYWPTVVDAALAAGARVVNLTGSADDERIFAAVADADATLILCQSVAANVREVTDADTATDPFVSLLEHFGPRAEAAAAAGVENLVLDPGLGFYYGDLVDPLVRVRYQTEVLLQTFRLRRLGLPVCHAMPHAFDLFEEEFRTAEGFFTVLARLGGVGMLRVHEVARVGAVLRALGMLSP